MEAFMYRCHPQTQQALALCRDGSIGDVQHIEATFGFNAPFDAQSRLFNSDLAGGGIMDVGCYPVSISRLIMGAEPEDITVAGTLTESGVDAFSTALLRFPDKRSASIGTGVQLTLDNQVRIYGDRGRITLDLPWHPGRLGTDWSFTLQRDGSKPETISGSCDPLYVLEADEVARCLHAGLIESPDMSHADSLGNATVLDRWRAGLDLTFSCEAADTTVQPLLGYTAQSNDIDQGRIPFVDKPVSRLVMGCDNQPNMRHASVMWDHFVSRGGNAFDTAYIYGGGSMEALLGQWQEARGIRDDIVIVGKGAHTPDNFPDRIAPQLSESLERLRTDHVDVYCLHRDNLDVPVSEFVSALNDELRAGRIRAFGGSNWTEARVREANDWAAANGLQGFSAVSNNFSLARMVRRIWPGVEAASDDSYREYLEASQIALLPWSSQARGFFTEWAAGVIAGAGAEHLTSTSVEPSVAELKRTWFSDDNLERRRRAEALAAERGTSLITVALAYVLGQAFPVFALVGPRTLAETDSCIDALSLTLTPGEVAWLDLRSENR